MTDAYKIIPNPVYTNCFHFFQIWQPAIFSRFHKTTLCTYICFHYTNSKYILTKYYKLQHCTNVRRILLCFSVRSVCTWKIVFKTQNHELNELSECILYKMFFFSEKHLKTVKLSLTIIFLKPYLLTLKFLKLFVLACF